MRQEAGLNQGSGGGHGEEEMGFGDSVTGMGKRNRGWLGVAS